MPKRILHTALLLCALSTGCGRSNSPSKGPASPPKPAADGSATNSNTDKPQQPSPQASQTADAAVQAVFDGLRQGKPQALWEFLPPSFQNDINDLVHEFANRMDAELWSRSFAILKRVIGILKTKKTLILELPELKSVASSEISRNWDATVELVGVIVNSELSDLVKLKKFDGEAFLTGTGGKLVSQMIVLSKLSDESLSPFRILEGTEVSLIRSSDQSAIVSIEGPGHEPRNHEYVNVEGKWIPKTWADGWKNSMVAAKSRLAASLTPQRIAKNKQAVLARFDEVDRVLDKLEAATTAEQFHPLLPQAVAQITSIFSWKTPNHEKPTPKRILDADSATVSVRILGELDEAAKEAIEDKLLRLADDPDSDGYWTAETGKLEFRLLPVTDVKAFAARIDFAKVVDVDPDGRIVSIQLAKSKPPNVEKKPR